MHGDRLKTKAVDKPGISHRNVPKGGGFGGKKAGAKIPGHSPQRAKMNKPNTGGNPGKKMGY